ncbi:unnamed protein product, partial [Owenia fusiformis]
ILPGGCFPLALTSCPAVFDAEIGLSSTAEWYQLNSNTNVKFTLGIAFVVINSFPLPISLRGVQVETGSNWKLSLVSSYRKEMDGTLLNTPRKPGCNISLTLQDVQDFIKGNSFINTYFNSLTNLLPKWISILPTDKTLLGTTNLKSSVMTGEQLSLVKPCAGAPVFKDKIYSTFRFETDTKLVVFDHEVTIPVVQGQQFCVIVDLCQDLGGTVILMFPTPLSRRKRDTYSGCDVLSKIPMVGEIENSTGFDICIRGMGFSLTKQLAVTSRFSKTSTAVELWNGDQRFDYKLFPAAHVWIAGEAHMAKTSKELSVNISADMQIFVTVPNPMKILTRVFLEKWNVLVEAIGGADVAVSFELFSKMYTISMPKTGLVG